MNTDIVSAINPSDKSALMRFVLLERKPMKNYLHYISEIDDDVAKMLTPVRLRWLKRWSSVCSLFQNQEKM